MATPSDEKPQFVTASSPDEETGSSNEHLHIVARSSVLPLPDKNDAITGYDPAVMGARATLSSEEEKKVLRRIDWRLLPLLALIYMIKTIDAANVCLFLSFFLLFFFWAFRAI